MSRTAGVGAHAAQIASGRHTVTVFDAYAVDQSICFTLAGTRTPDSVRLRARVVEVRETPIHGSDWAHLYDLTVEFEHPREAIKTMIHRLVSAVTRPGWRGASSDRRGSPARGHASITPDAIREERVPVRPGGAVSRSCSTC